MTKQEQIDAWAGEIHTALIAHWLTTPDGTGKPSPRIAYIEADSLWEAREVYPPRHTKTMGEL